MLIGSSDGSKDHLNPWDTRSGCRIVHFREKPKGPNEMLMSFHTKPAVSVNRRPGQKSFPFRDDRCCVLSLRSKVARRQNMATSSTARCFKLGFGVGLPVGPFRAPFPPATYFSNTHKSMGFNKRNFVMKTPSGRLPKSLKKCDPYDQLGEPLTRTEIARLQLLQACTFSYTVDFSVSCLRI